MTKGKVVSSSWHLRTARTNQPVSLEVRGKYPVPLPKTSWLRCLPSHARERLGQELGTVIVSRLVPESSPARRGAGRGRLINQLAPSSAYASSSTVVSTMSFTGGSPVTPTLARPSYTASKSLGSNRKRLSRSFI